MKRYSPEEIALFIKSSADLSSEPDDEIIAGLERWDEHMHAGGFKVGYDDEGWKARHTAMRLLFFEKRDRVAELEARIAELEAQ